MTPAERPLSGAERAALVLRELGEGLAIDILRQMDEQAITKICFAKDFGVSDIGEDGMKFITQLLTSALGETQARMIIEALSKTDRQSPFHKIDPQTMAIQMSTERPQTIALLLAHVPHETGASMLSYLPEALAASALYRFTLLDAVSPGAVKELREMFGEIIVII